MDKPLIEVRNFSYSYPRTLAPVLKNISFTINQGEFVGIVGPTGAGKTSLCLALCGLIPHMLGGQIDGEILLAGNNTAATPLEKLLYAGVEHTALVGITFQDPEAQLVGMTVEEDIAFGPENLGIPTNAINQRVTDTLQLVGMAEYRYTFPYKLSGGQKQRIAIGATLALLPQILILDEPTSELDPVGRDAIFSILQDLKARSNLTILVVEHHTEELARFTDRIIVLQDGSLVLDDVTATVFQQIDLLRSVGVRPPEWTELLEELRRLGLVEPPPGVISEEQVVAFLRDCLVRVA